MDKKWGKKVLVLITSLIFSGLSSISYSAQFNQYLLAVQLANLGYAQKDPLLLMAAAKMVKNAPLQPINLAQKKTNAKSKPLQNGDKHHRYHADQLLNQAEQYAGRQAQMILLIQEIRSQKSRGLSDGAKMHKDQVLANGFDYYKLTFEADAIAKVGVISDDSQQDLDLFVVDATEQDKIVCQDTGVASGSLCEWMPNQEQDYIIKIKNRSAAISSYTLILN